MLFQAKVNAQDFKQSMKSRPADFEYLSAPDSLGVRHKLKMPNIVTNKKSSQSAAAHTKLPYPIIFIHGLNSGSNTWNTFTNFMDLNYLLTYGGRFDISLNDDNDLYNANLNVYPNPAVGADIAMYQSTLNVGGDYYYVNFAVDSGGAYDEACTNKSNQSAIVKQGKALQNVIKNVMQLTGRDKVVLMGHSMGGLAAREYLQNTDNWQIDGQHHVAKLVTTGTPHGGSNATGPDLSLISSKLPDPQSEAVRDLRKSYSWSLQPGVFLNGGVESQSVMNDFSLSLNNFYNFDVNCNGITGELIEGLNFKPISTDLDYACVIGDVLNLGGDGVVKTSSANLNNIYSNITQNIFSTSTNHLSLTSKSYENIQGLDEPYQYELAYNVGFNKDYYGFITTQSQSSPYLIDYDEYTFTLAGNSQVNINIGNTLPINIYAKIVDINGNIVDGITYSSNGTTSIAFSKSLISGKYYLEISGNPTATTYQSPYFFNINFTSLSTDNFELSSPITVYPNPTKSKVSFDNSISNFEKVSIANSLGQEVFKSSFSTFINTQEVDMSKLPVGVYLLKLSNQKRDKTVKVIKE